MISWHGVLSILVTWVESVPASMLRVNVHVNSLRLFQEHRTVLLLFDNIFIFVLSDFQDPYAIAVLLQNDLVVIDLTSQG
jgi:hypothetical protein